MAQAVGIQEIKINKIELLQLLSEKVSKCEKCPELVKNRTQTVFGEGNENANIMFVGECPGQNEDEQGRPFVGLAGQLLDNIIKACGWKREDIYILNILKCRPPNNRTPTRQEACNCEPYLKLQIQIINPKFIVCFGTTAAKYLLKLHYPISYMRGKWYKYQDKHVNADVICTYHPSYALHKIDEGKGDEVKQEMWEDMQILVKKL